MIIDEADIFNCTSLGLYTYGYVVRRLVIIIIIIIILAPLIIIIIIILAPFCDNLLNYLIMMVMQLLLTIYKITT